MDVLEYNYLIRDWNQFVGISWKPSYSLYFYIKFNLHLIYSIVLITWFY